MQAFTTYMYVHTFLHSQNHVGMFQFKKKKKKRHVCIHVHPCINTHILVYIFCLKTVKPCTANHVCIFIYIYIYIYIYMCVHNGVHH
jgi:hypothetical protein